MAHSRSLLSGILGLRCPYCREGDFFVSHPYDLRRAGDTHDVCPKCGGRFSIEPGFYYGAMYVSYALTVAMATAVWVAIQVLWPSLSMEGTILAIVLALIVTGPWLYALSKVIWACMFLPTKQARKS